MRGSDWDAVRLAVLERDQWLCTWPECNKPLEGDDATVDHVTPVQVARNLGWSRSEINDPSNLVAMCRRHNGMKRDQVVLRVDYRAPAWFGA